MGREIRYIRPNSLQHVTDVTFQNRYFLRPSKESNERILGILGRAQAKFEMRICAVVALSTHIHYLLQPRDGAQLAAFMCFVKTNIAKEIGKKLLGWHGSFFDGRYRLTPVSDEEADQVNALRYLLAHGVKENLVDSVQDWPGIHSALSTIEGKAMAGKWIDRTSAFYAGRRSPNADVNAFTHEERVVISPLPCWQHLTPPQWRCAVADLVEHINEEATAERRETGRSSLGVTEILSAEPKRRPAELKKMPKRRFHARDPNTNRAMFATWQEIVRRFREASEKLRAGFRNVAFPEGTFPPGLPMVPFSPETLQSASSASSA